MTAVLISSKYQLFLKKHTVKKWHSHCNESSKTNLPSEFEMNLQRLKELEMINSCRHDTQDAQVYESNLSKQTTGNLDSELESVVRDILNNQH